MAADVGPAPTNSPFLKHLASSSSQTRASALDHLRTYLRANTSLDYLSILKLWKGLFYCVWHSDRPRAQHALCRGLAGLLHTLPNNVVKENWLRAFWETMAREWEGITGLRMDKFLSLCRMYVGAGLEWCRRSGWDDEVVQTVLGIVQETPLSTEVERPKMTNGLRFHVLDVWVDELEQCMSNEEVERAPIEVLMRPVMKLEEMTRDGALRKKAKEVLKDERVVRWLDGDSAVQRDDETQDETERTEDDDAEEDDEEWGGIDEG